MIIQRKAGFIKPLILIILLSLLTHHILICYPFIHLVNIIIIGTFTVFLWHNYENIRPISIEFFLTNIYYIKTYKNIILIHLGWAFGHKNYNITYLYMFHIIVSNNQLFAGFSLSAWLIICIIKPTYIIDICPFI